MIKLYICCSVLIIGSVEKGPDMNMKFHQGVMEIVSYDTCKTGLTVPCCAGINSHIAFIFIALHWTLIYPNSAAPVFFTVKHLPSPDICPTMS